MNMFNLSERKKKYDKLIMISYDNFFLKPYINPPPL